MTNDKLYIIKGTGLSLDGQVVRVVEVVGDYSVVAPPQLDSLHNTMVKSACLQPLSKKKTYVYEFTIEKFASDEYQCGDGSEFVMFAIEDALRGVGVDVIKEFIETNLTPILRMD